MNTGILNQNNPLVMHAGDCSRGLGWNLPNLVGTLVSATLVLENSFGNAIAPYTGQSLTVIAPVAPASVAYDWPIPNTLPAGEYYAYAQLVLSTGRTDTTQSIRITVLATGERRSEFVSMVRPMLSRGSKPAPVRRAGAG